MNRAFLIAVVELWCAVPASAARFVPGGPGAVQMLLGPSSPSPAVVRAEVARDGFYSGAPLGAGDCAICHADAAAQWASSAHRFASFNNPYYAAAVNALRDEKGPRSSRFCADCHDPLLVADDAIDGPIDLTGASASVAAQAGIVCLVCHSVDALDDARGNGHIHVKLDPVPRSGTPAHAARLRPALLASASFCGACHKVGLPEDLTGERWLRGQNDYDAWHDSALAGQGAAAVRRPLGPTETKRCQDCHMPLEPAVLGDLGARNGLIRSHRFLGGNTALPHLRGDVATEARTGRFLRGAVTVALFASSRGQGGEGGDVDVVLRNRRVGHRFPGGTGDSNEAWVEVTALDEAGRVLGQSGGLDAEGTLDAEAHRVRAQPVDKSGHPIARRDVQHMRGVAFDTSLSPADPQAVRYRVPPETRLVRARLLYRKFDRAYLAFACAAVKNAATRERCEHPPVVEMASAELRLAPAGHPPAPPSDDGGSWESLVDHGLALADALVDRAGEALAPLARAAALVPERPEPQLALARVAVALGRTDEALAILDRLDAGGAPHPASLWLRATALHHAYRDAAALVPAERLAARLPDDRNALGLLARLRGLAGDAEGALTIAERLLVIDPEAEEGLLERMLSLRDLHRDDKDAEAAYLRHRRAVETDLALRRLCSAAHPALAEESVPVHTHVIGEGSRVGPPASGVVDSKQ